MNDLLRPGSHRVAGRLDDAALVRAMLTVEAAWLAALAQAGVVTSDDRKTFEDVVRDWQPELDPLAVEGAGNPVLPLVTALRERLDPQLAGRVHTGLTSQDVLDTALVLLARDVARGIDGDLEQAEAALAGLAREHRDSVMAGRTLTQYAVPVTFGLVAAQWLAGVADARAALASAVRHLPVQCGGAAGTLSRAADLVPDPLATGRAFARELGLAWPGLPWHTRRTPVTRLGDAMVECCDALGVIAADVSLLGRPETGEVTEGAAPGRGGSSTMPHKQNPVLSVLIRSASLRAPGLGAQLHTGAATAVDQRPDGAWHAEWPALRDLLATTAVAASQGAELVSRLDVHADVMRRRAQDAAEALLAERRRDAGDVHDYLGAAGAFVDHVLRSTPGGRP